jgi:hypothetical protein
MPLLAANEFARRGETGRLEVRPGPMRVRWNLDDLVTADGHKLHCAFTASVTALSEPSERRMLEEVFLHRGRAVTAEAVIAHFLPGLRAAAGQIASKHSAAEWVDGDLKQAMIEPLEKAAKDIAFTAGVDIRAPYDVAFESPTYKSQKIEEMERTLAERRVAGQVEHFERASRLLKQFEELRHAAPDLSAADVLKQVSPADQGLMLQTLLLAAGKANSTMCLWAVAGTSLVKIDGRATPATIEQVGVPQTLGPLRSVQPARVDGRDVLLIGARSGVLVFDPASRESHEYIDASIQSQLGFSKAVIWNGKLWGCHGDAGLVGWTLGDTAAPVQVFRPIQLRGPDDPGAPPPAPTMPSPTTSMSISTQTSGIGNLTPVDENLLALSVGRALTVLDTQGRLNPIDLPTRAPIIGVFVDGQRLVVADAAGTVITCDRSSLLVQSERRRTGPTKAAALLPWLGSNRLLLASEEGPVYCVGFDDDLISSYTSSHRELRILSASADLVAAVSSDRQRVLLWNSWDGKKPLAELNVASATKHRVGDIEFA